MTTTATTAQIIADEARAEAIARDWMEECDEDGLRIDWPELYHHLLTRGLDPAAASKGLNRARTERREQRTADRRAAQALLAEYNELTDRLAQFPPYVMSMEKTLLENRQETLIRELSRRGLIR